MEKNNEYREEMISTIASLFKTLPYDIKKQPLKRLNINPTAVDALSAIGIYTVGQLFGDKNAKYDVFSKTGETLEYKTSGESADKIAHTSSYTPFENTESVNGTKNEGVFSSPEKSDSVGYSYSPVVSAVIKNAGFTSTIVGAPETSRYEPVEIKPDVETPVRELPNGIRRRRDPETAAEDPVHYDTSVSGADTAAGDLPDSIKRMSVINLRISGRAANALMRSKVSRIGQLASMSREKLLSIRNLGEETAEEILREMALLSEQKENYFNE